MKLAILGGGGFRVPLVHGQVLADRRIDQVSLYDTDLARLEAMDHVLAGQSRAIGRTVPRVSTTSLQQTLDGADFVFSAIRVGGVAGRVIDEQVALRHGVLGQETTGAGGIAYGIRTVPVALRIAEEVRRCCPAAWVVNFTNPAGLVTQAMQRVLGNRVVGICDSPIGLTSRAARVAGLSLAEVEMDYAGLNHLGWLQRLLHDGVDVLPRVLADPALARTEEGQLFGQAWLADLGSIPNEYLYYYYFTRDAIASIRGASASRGQFLQRQQESFYAGVAADSATAYEQWVRVRRERDETYLSEARTESRDEADVAGGGYERVALALMDALAGGRPSTLILNVANGSTLPGLPSQTVVEVPCAVEAGQIRPLTVTPLRGHALGLVQQVAASYDNATRAGISGSRADAVRAFAFHPLVDSVTVARELVTAYGEASPEFAAVVQS